MSLNDIRFQINGDIRLTTRYIVILNMLGFRWRSNQIRSEPLTMFKYLSESSSISYIGLDLGSGLLTYSRTEISDGRSFPTIQELFEILNEAFKRVNIDGIIPATRKDVGNNLCITIDKDFDIICKDGQLCIYGIESEVEPEICKVLDDFSLKYRKLLNNTIDSFQNKYSFKPGFYDYVIERIKEKLLD